MGDAWFDVVLVLALVTVNAFLSGTEMALVSLRDSQRDELANAGRRGRKVAELAASPSRYLSALQLGITLAGFLASASAAVELSATVAPALDFLGGSADAAAVVVVTILVSLITLVFGELVPKRIAMLHAERWSLATVDPISWFMVGVRPILWLLEVMTDAVVRFTGNDPSSREAEMSDEELARLIRARASLDPDQRRIMVEAIAASERTLRQILVPRPQVVSVDVSDSAEDAVARLREVGFSRAPLVNNDLDHPVGHVHVLDLVQTEGPARDSARPILALPESLSALRALRRLQTSGTKLAVVIDEHGGTEGIVTIEDITEELVGEINDELDDEPLEAIGGTVSGMEATTSIVLPGSFPIHRMDELEMSLPTGSYVTVAGLLLERLGHLPEVGERVIVDDYEITVTGATKTMITAVNVRRLAPRGT